MHKGYLLTTGTFFVGILNLFSQTDLQPVKSKLCVEYVNAFIGTSAVGNAIIGTTSGGNTHPGAVRPFGMVSLNPHNDCNAPNGYFFGRPYIYGFGHVHMSGVGCPDLGNVVIMPGKGAIKTNPEGYKSAYRNEVAYPGYYKVDLIDDDVKAEMTTTLRSGISKYTFNKGSDSSNILIDLSQGIFPKLVSNPPKEGHLKIINDNEIEGYNYSGDFCHGKSFQAVYFVARFSKKASTYGFWKDSIVSAFKAGDTFKTAEVDGKSFGAFFSYKTKPGEEIYIKVGISYVSTENARLNLDTEQAGWDFQKIKTESSQEWEHALSKIEVTGGTEKQKTIFYTGLYHMLFHPNVFSDVNGDYQAMRPYPSHALNGIKKSAFTRYTVFSLWDTYRNVHPFFSLVYPSRQLDMVKTLIEMGAESGRLPKWELAGGETFTMVGDPALPVIADTYIKGIKNFDTGKAFRVMQKNADTTEDSKPTIRPGLRSYLHYGYIPQNDTREWLWGPVSTTLEYNFADWSLAQFAQAIGQPKAHDAYLKRSLFYKNYYDSVTGFLRPKNKDGSFFSPFKPDTLQGTDLKFKGAGGAGFVEGNAWHYQFFVPHDIDGLKVLMGGDKQFVSKLQNSFDRNKYVLCNEPDMAYPFLFDYVAGEGWRTQREVSKQLETHFGTGPDGLPGNDDCGTLSGFYVFAAMGFYPACPASEIYQVCSPVFDKITIHLDTDFYKGSKFVIQLKNNTQKNRYIQSVALNGLPYNKQFIDHKDIVNGGLLEFVMGAKPKK
jgi:predicted alpha-1,2-mannosidase